MSRIKAEAVRTLQYESVTRVFLQMKTRYWVAAGETGDASTDIPLMQILEEPTHPIGLTLIASVRQRRRQFALLKALGFTQRQISASVAWQSSVAAVVGVVLGIPIGIALGRWLWTLFADGISAVPHPSVATLSIAAVALGAVVFANLVALIPGRVAARTRTSLLLRSE